MEPLLWLLLPVAAASGWYASQLTPKQKHNNNASSLNKNYIQGLNYLINEQPDKAIEALISAVDTDHETVDTHLVLGMLFLRRGEVDRAIRIHQNIIARPNLSSQQREAGMIALGNDYLKAGVLDRAENIFHKLVENGSKDTRAYKKLQQLYEQEKDWKQAVDMSAHLVRLGEQKTGLRTAQYYCELADITFANNDHAQTLKLIKKALSHDADSLRATLLKGDVYTKKSDWKKARKCYIQALDDNHRFAQLVYERIYLLHQHSKDLTGLKTFFQSEAEKNIPAARMNLLKVLLELGEQSEAENLLKQELSRKNALPVMVKHYLRVMQSRSEGEINDAFATLYRLLDREISGSYAYKCMNCGFESRSLIWHCPSCMAWGKYKPGKFLDSIQ